MTAASPPQGSPVLILPLPKNVVILPGAGSILTTERIPISTAARPDLRALLGAAHVRAGSQGQAGRIDSVPIICVPMASPFLGPQGQLLLTEQGHQQGQEDPDAPEFNYRTCKPSDLFNCGVAVRITAVQGRAKGEISLVVEGNERVRIDEITKTKPCYEGRVTAHADEVTADLDLEQTFQRLKHLSRHYLSVLRLHFIMLEGSMTISRLARKYDAYVASKTVAESGVLSDFMARSLTMTYEDKLQVLAAFDIKTRMLKIIELLERHIGNLKGKVEVTPVTSMSFPITIINDNQSDERAPIWPPPGLQRRNSQSRRGIPPQFLPPGGNRRMPGNQGDDDPDEFDELQKKLDAAKLSPEAAKVAEKELRRLKKMQPAQAEFSVIRNYLETLAEIPWSTLTHDRLGPETLPRARKQLDDDHYGLDKVKKRLLEYLAVLKLKQSTNEEVDAQIKRAEQEVVALENNLANDAGNGSSEALAGGTAPEASSGASPVQKEAVEAKLTMLRRKRMVDKSPILLLVGPPGVGKTSLAKSVATALGRNFHRISLGGVRDEAEIRGHRRTYVAAMPGLIMAGLKKVGVANPVFLLDEIDKLGMSNHQGDPSAAMLEVLDPEQNSTFVDHFVAVPFDLSKVMFIATANNLETIPEPLLDRMEMITLPGYTTLEKRHIATRHLIPKQIRTNGLENNQVTFAPEAVSKIIEHYTREAGVRNLEREIGSVCRAKAVEFADAQDSGKLDKYTPQLTPADIERILGMEKFEDEIAETTSRPGVVTGLVAFSSGRNGSILFIEMADMPGSGTVQLTGKLGTVLQESVNVALSWVKQHAFDLGLTQDPTKDIMKGRSIHVHCTPGAVDKDGPSSGMAQAIGLISLFSGRAVPPSLAMTGELSLRGRVTRVGGIKEKLIGALRAGVKTVMLPEQNRKDAQDLPQEVKDGLDIIHVGHVWEAIHHVWPKVHFPGERPGPFVQSVL